MHPFEKATKRIEGNASSGSHGALWEVLPTFDYLFAGLKRRADEITSNPELFTDHYRHCVNYGFIKLSSYYTKTDDSRFYSAVLALHPCNRFDYFDKKWHQLPDGDVPIARAKTHTSNLDNEYVQRARDASEPPPPSQPQSSHDYDEDWQAIFCDHTYADDDDTTRSRKRRKQASELDNFMVDKLDTTYVVIEGGKRVRKSYYSEPLRWWRERGESLYPTLATMAYDLFSSLGMSAECERAFSAAKRMVTDERYNLSPKSVEADQCVKSWLKQQIADGRAAWQDIAHGSGGGGGDELHGGEVINQPTS